ncbi:MAG: acyl-CoA reductase, partial [Myxococcota bacterium]
MTPAEIRSALEAVRKAGCELQQRPAARRLDALAALLDDWRDPGSPARRHLEETLPAFTGFSPEMVRDGLALSLEPLSGDALHQLVERELGGTEALEGHGSLVVSSFETTGVLLAGALPTPTLLSLIPPLLLGAGVVAKTSAHDPCTAHCLRDTLARLDPGISACLEVVEFPGGDGACVEALLAADCVVAAGSDETVAAVRRRVRPPRRAILNGHRVSFAVIGPEIEGPRLEACAASLAVDVAIWDQLGCLSPVAVLTSGGRGADLLAEALAEALEDAHRRWPRGRLPEQAAADLAQQQDEAEFRAASGRAVRVFSGAGSTVVREDGPRLRSAPLHRFVRIHPCDGVSDIVDALRPLGPHLGGVALAGFDADRAALATRLGRLGASRICPPGQLQTPPLGWHHDGRGVLAPSCLIPWGRPQTSRSVIRASGARTPRPSWCQPRGG